ncbi:MAG: GNAT family N-acetyltransferase [Candidatus Cryptobacteroides sp.]
MPRQVQFSANIIIKACLDIIRTDGAGALSARTICNRMGCSVAPIFRAFKNMDDLMQGVREEAERYFCKYMADTKLYMPAFKEFGMRMIRFSREEANLFRFLFLDIDGRNEMADSIARECLKQTESAFGLTSEQAELIYRHLWPYLCGFSQLCNKNSDIYTDEYISEMMSTMFQSLITLLKSDYQVVVAEPHLIPEGERIYLRRWKESDAEVLFNLAKDPELGPHAGWPPHQSVEESLDAIRTYFSNDTTWAVVLKETDGIVGCAGYHLTATGNIPLKEDEVEVGYWISRNYWNQGLCTEALGIVVEHCRMTGSFTTLYGEHFLDNPASGRVMEKCGFADTGERRTCPSLLVGADKEVRVLKLPLR